MISLGAAFSGVGTASAQTDTSAAELELTLQAPRLAQSVSVLSASQGLGFAGWLFAEAVKEGRDCDLLCFRDIYIGLGVTVTLTGIGGSLARTAMATQELRRRRAGVYDLSQTRRYAVGGVVYDTLYGTANLAAAASLLAFSFVDDSMENAAKVAMATTGLMSILHIWSLAVHIKELRRAKRKIKQTPKRRVQVIGSTVTW